MPPKHLVCKQPSLMGSWELCRHLFVHAARSHSTCAPSLAILCVNYRYATVGIDAVSQWLWYSGWLFFVGRQTFSVPHFRQLAYLGVSQSPLCYATGYILNYRLILELFIYLWVPGVIVARARPFVPHGDEDQWWSCAVCGGAVPARSITQEKVIAKSEQIWFTHIFLSPREKVIEKASRYGSLISPRPHLMGDRTLRESDNIF
jgi:hypothetical protein